MSTVKRIVCLANSHKPGGRCVAGKELLPDGGFGKWIRPVGSGKQDAVSDYERQYEGGGEPQLLDVIDVPIVKALPKTYQQENWVVDSHSYWTKVRRATRTNLQRMLDPVSPLWLNGHGNTNDRVPVDLAHMLKDSLRLIKVDLWEIEVSRWGMKGHFRYAGEEYRLRITDPAYTHYSNFAQGAYDIGESYLTISLGEPFQNPGTGSWDCYKLIAGIMAKS